MIGTHRTTTTNIPINNEQSRLIVTFHNTAVVQVINDRYVILNSGGWLTPTTKRRMNQASEVYRLNYLVYQKNHIWYVKTPSTTAEFADHIVIDKVSGNILPSLP